MVLFPFDRQVFRAVFKVIGYDTSEVRLQVDPDLTGLLEEGVDAVGNAAWRVESVVARASEDTSVIASPVGIAPASLLEVSITAARIPGYMLRSIVAPLVLLITLSWSVFWMSRESLGDRINLSFIGLLTVVAFQTIVDDDIAQIPYFTAMNSFLLINYVLLAGTIVVNLRVGYLDAAGRSRDGDAIDRRLSPRERSRSLARLAGRDRTVQSRSASLSESPSADPIPSCASREYYDGDDSDDVASDLGPQAPLDFIAAHD